MNSYRCNVCGQYVWGNVWHTCGTAPLFPPTQYTQPYVKPCEHCFCQKVNSKGYTSSPADHIACCMCKTRKLAVSPDVPPPDVPTGKVYR